MKRKLRIADDDENSSGGAYFKKRNAKSDITLVSSGCALLDCVLGGGWPLGRVANIVGDKSTGKTLLAIEACANFFRQFPKGRILYEEAESAFDLSYARALGLPDRNIEIKQDVATVEGMFTDLSAFIASCRKANTPGLVVLDSLDALSDEAEMQRDLTEGTYGTGKAKQMSQLFRRLVRELEQAKVLVIIISQVRDNIGVTFGRKTTRSGGRALDFYASQVLYLAQIKTLKKTIKGVDRAVGVRIKAKCDKNKIGLPFRECEMNIRFNYGIDDVLANLEWLDEVKRLDAVEMSKADIQAINKEMESMNTASVVEIRDTVADAVREVWEEIEASFAPKRGKYE